MYSIAQKLLFCLPPESSHNVALKAIEHLPDSALRQFQVKHLIDTPRHVMGLHFPNAVGLAAGLDKNADFFNSLAQFGFGFIEVGSVTPKAQPGNDKPRLFRLTGHQAIINRMGFNNKGLQHLIDQVKNRRFNGVLGINIGKNLTTPIAQADQDYAAGLAGAYPYADYITVNISSPNTPGLRNLQLGEQLQQLLASIKNCQRDLAQEHGRLVPVAVKIAPDMSSDDISTFCDAARKFNIDGVIAGNTTSSRNGVEKSQHHSEAGGLSGRPLTEKARQTISHLAQRLQGEIPIIGCGGISSGEDAVAHLKAGADLIQIYTGFIYRGPELINEARHAIKLSEEKHG
ncbi:dihydroorotate dehydrogenase (quinone) [Chromatiales bacterium (ex Bugula neritina AB1)]|nr:dihydroorotate dehydrogenase (quinone) [Chromatiales bacterium (ex Bugula neritina AB1)]